MTGGAPPVERSRAASPEDASRSAPSRNANSMSAIGLKRALAAGEQAAFLWSTRSTVARSSAVTFEVLAHLDERVSGLAFRLSERPAVAEWLLRHDAPAFRSGFAFVTAVVALRNGVDQVVDNLLAQLESEPALLAPLSSALSWLEYREVRRYVEHWLAMPTPALVRLGIAAAVAHRMDPGTALDRALDADLPVLRATGLEAVGRLSLRAHLPVLIQRLDDEDDACRFWAAWSAARLGDQDGIPVLGRFAATPGAFALPACDLALRVLDPDQAIRAQRRLLSIPGNEGVATASAGIIGDPRLAGWLLEAMASPALARRAAAAFCVMAGCDLRRDDLDASAPPGAVPQADPSSGAALEGEEEEDELLWPDLDRLRQWWQGNRQAFTPGVRYLAGLPIRPEDLPQILLAGNQRQRAAAALELALLNPEAPVLDVEAPAHRQRGPS